MQSSNIVFAGLGNPGVQYQLTRHNMGYLVVQTLGRKMGWYFKEDRRFNALITKGLIDGTTVHLIQPTTFMNLSGVAIQRYLDFFKIDISRLVVVIDDVALPFGELRLKPTGSAGGHNGLKSVQAHLNTSHYMRLRMGIGHPGESVLSDYVLDPFRKEELEQLETFVGRGVEVLERLIKESVSQVMNAVNTKPQKNITLGDE
ncbi:MAG: aminoacyl-tRNA hydrolase [Parachlamydiaceae bacterium]|nr:aminoacyl-tRNA hydrolase [Parachlamydiaceae bacterium]